MSFDCCLPRHGFPIHPYNTRKYPGENIGGQTSLLRTETALKTDMCGEAVLWVTKGEVMHDLRMGFDHW